MNKTKLITIFIFIFLFQINLFCQKDINWIIVIDGKIPTYFFPGELTFFYNNEKIKTECRYYIGRFLIEDNNFINILENSPDTTKINITLDYYYYKNHICGYERIEQQYTFNLRKFDLLNCGYLIISIINNRDKTYEIALSASSWSHVKWLSKKMKKNRKLFKDNVP